MTTAVANKKRGKLAKKTKTLVVNFVLDETGSMGMCKDATIHGFNEYVGDLVKRPETICFTLTKFNSSKIEVVHSGVPVGQVAKLNQDSYRPAHLTPLYDAVARTIKATDEALETIKGDTAVLCVIQTDGQENASHEYKREDIFRLIKEKEAQGWTFAYLGADQDTWQAEAMGIHAGSTMSYVGDPAGTRTAFKGVATATADYASSGGVQTDAFFDKSAKAPTPAAEPDDEPEEPKLRDW